MSDQRDVLVKGALSLHMLKQHLDHADIGYEVVPLSGHVPAENFTAYYRDRTEIRTYEPHAAYNHGGPVTTDLIPPPAVRAYCARCHETRTLRLHKADMQRLIHQYACTHCGWQGAEITSHFARDLPQPTGDQ